MHWSYIFLTLTHGHDKPLIWSDPICYDSVVPARGCCVVFPGGGVTCRAGDVAWSSVAVTMWQLPPCLVMNYASNSYVTGIMSGIDHSRAMVQTANRSRCGCQQIWFNSGRVHTGMARTMGSLDGTQHGLSLNIMIPMYRLWLQGLYRLHGPRCPLSQKGC